MANAMLTNVKLHVVPTDHLTVEHALRCLWIHGGRVVEFVSPVTIRYPTSVMFYLRIVFVDEETTMYADKDGWLFGEDALTNLLIAQKLAMLED